MNSEADRAFYLPFTRADWRPMTPKELRRLEKLWARTDRIAERGANVSAVGELSALARPDREGEAIEGTMDKDYAKAKRRPGLAPAGTFAPWARSGDRAVSGAPLGPGPTRYRFRERTETRYRWRESYVPSVPAEGPMRMPRWFIMPGERANPSEESARWARTYLSPGDEITLGRTRWYEVPTEVLNTWGPQTRPSELAILERSRGRSEVAERVRSRPHHYDDLPEGRTQTPHGVTTSPDIASTELAPPWESYLVRVPDLPGGELTEGQHALIDLQEERAGGPNFGRSHVAWVDDDGTSRERWTPHDEGETPEAIFGERGGWHWALNEATGFPAGRTALDDSEQALEGVRQSVGFTPEEFGACLGRRANPKRRRELAASVVAYLTTGGHRALLIKAYDSNGPTIDRLRRSVTPTLT